MLNIINSITDTSKDIIFQLIDEEILIGETKFTRQLELKENISIITSFTSKKKSFQISINFSQDLVRKISSLVQEGVPIVLIDEESKHIVMEISKLIISNSIICLEYYDQDCFLSPPIIIEGEKMKCSTNGLVGYIEYELMNEKFTISIFPIDKEKDISSIKLNPYEN